MSSPHNSRASNGHSIDQPENNTNYDMLGQKKWIVKTIFKMMLLITGIPEVNGANVIQNIPKQDKNQLQIEGPTQ